LHGDVFTVNEIISAYRSKATQRGIGGDIWASQKKAKTMMERFTRPIYALGLLGLAMALIPLNDALIKILSAHISLGQVVAVRAILSLILVVFVSDGLRAMLHLPGPIFWQFVGRAMCLVVAMLLFFVSLGSLPLANVIAIFFVSPMIITLLSVPLLGESIGIHRLASVSAGMAGVLMIMQPGSGDFHPENLLVIGSAFSYALFQIWTRRLKADGSLSAMVTVQHLCYFVVGAIMVVANVIWPVSPTGNPTLDFLLRGPMLMSVTDWLFILICCVSVLFLSVASSNAYRSIEASVIAPFEYTAIPFGAFWGVVIWGEWPATSAWIGMLLILFGGIYTLFRENIRNVDVATSVPMPAAAAAQQNFDEETESQDNKL
jgi:drug/metabolite transporter (DMT)-like permease